MAEKTKPERCPPKSAVEARWRRTTKPLCKGSRAVVELPCPCCGDSLVMHEADMGWSCKSCAIHVYRGVHGLHIQSFLRPGPFPKDNGREHKHSQCYQVKARVKH